jgi:DNA polymerase V
MHAFDSLSDGAAVGRTPPDETGPRKNPVSAGFGSPGDDATVKRINLNDALIAHPQATFVMRAAGAAMQAAGVGDGDVLLVDRAVKAVHGSIVIAVVEGELLCRRLWQKPGDRRLRADGAGHADIAIAEGNPVEIWGVVTTAIKSLLP